MSSPGLSPFLSYPPSYPLTTKVKTIVQELAQSVTPWPSHIVVIDAQQRPLGVLAVGRLWAGWEAAVPIQELVSITWPLTELRHSPQPVAALQLEDCQHWLEPILLVPAQTPLADLSSRILGNPQSYWVVVQEGGQYQGMINPALLAVWLLSQPSEPMPQPLTQPSPPVHRWVMAIGHALKTPLTSLLGLSTLLLDPRVGDLNDRQAHYASLMRQAIRQLIRLINQLVDWMRLESDSLVVELTPVELQPLMDTLLPTFLTGWLPNSVPQPSWVADFRVNTPAHPVSIRADRLRLQQSLHGILDYCLQQGAEPGGITLDRWGPWWGITLWANSPNPDALSMPAWANASALDTDTEFLDKLGLVLARRFCQSQGGELTILGSAVHGCQITLLLPSAETAPEAALTTTLVLLVSGRGDCSDQVYGLLKDSPYRLVVTPNWQEAIALIQRLQPSTLLLEDGSLAIAPVLALAEAKQLQATPQIVLISATATPLTSAEITVLSPHALEHTLRPTLDQLGALPARACLGNLTMLLLSYPPHLLAGALTSQLSSPWREALQRCGCRLLEVDDLTQANLLCRVWQPHAILLDSGTPMTTDDWQHLTQFPDLTQCPLISLTPVQIEPQTNLTLIDGSATVAQSPQVGVAHLLTLIRQGQDPAWHPV